MTDNDDNTIRHVTFVNTKRNTVKKKPKPRKTIVRRKKIRSSPNNRRVRLA